jgi:hypothetical protein
MGALAGANAGAPAGIAEKEALAFSSSVRESFKRADYAKLAEQVCPQKGVRLTVGGHKVSTKEDVVLSADELRGAPKDKKSRTWGPAIDDQQVKGTIAERLKYVFKSAKAPSVAVNKISTGHQPGIAEAYPGAAFVELYSPGTEKNDNHDWAATYLVIERSGDKLCLAGIVEDSWQP